MVLDICGNFILGEISTQTLCTHRCRVASRQQESGHQRQCKLRCWRHQGAEENGRGIPISSRLGVRVYSPSGSAAEPRPQEHCKYASDSSNFHHFCVWEKCWNCSHGRTVLGQNDTFAPVVLRVPWHFFPLPLCSQCLCLHDKKLLL